MANDFKFYIPLQKQSNEWLSGIASTVSVDRDNERMSHAALEDMRKQIVENGVNLFSDHEHKWENTLGFIKEATLLNSQLSVKIILDNPKTNPKIPVLLEKLKRGINLGLSVGGAVTKEREEYNREVGKKVKIIDGVRLYEISVVGIPSNADAFLSLPQAISKCLHGHKTCPACYSSIDYYSDSCKICLWSN